MFILFPVLEVTQRVPPTCIIKISRTVVGRGRVRKGGGGVARFIVVRATGVGRSGLAQTQLENGKKSREMSI